MQYYRNHPEEQELIQDLVFTTEQLKQIEKIKSDICEVCNNSRYDCECDGAPL